MKLGKLITGFILSTLLAVGVGIGIGSGNKETKVAEAYVWPQAPTIYFCPSDNWISDNATFRMHYWNSNSGDTWQNGDVDGTLVNGTYSGRKVYKFKVTANNHYPNWVQFVRYNSTKSQEWNRSGNLAIHDSYYFGVDTFLMDKDSGSWSSWTDGSWYNSKNKILLASECSTPSLSTTRIFVHNSNTHWAGNGKTAIRAWGGSARETIFDSILRETVYNLSWFGDNNGVWYGYADIPVDVEAFQIVELESDTDILTKSKYNSQDITLSDAGNYVTYCGNDGNDVTFGTAQNDSGISLLSKVLEAVDTCSNGTYNGYNAYTRLNDNFYLKSTTAAKGNNATTLNGKSATVTTHFNGMLSRMGRSAAKPSLLLFNLNESKTSSAFIVIISSIATVAAFAGYFFYKKKKEDK